MHIKLYYFSLISQFSIYIFVCKSREQQWAKLSGEDAMINVEDFVIPFNENQHSFQVNKHVWCENATKIVSKNDLIKSTGIQEVNMWNYFAQTIIQKTGGSENTLFFMKVALKTQIIKVMRSPHFDYFYYCLPYHWVTIATRT